MPLRFLAYRLLLRAYPRGYRRECADEMQRTLRSVEEDVRQRGGRWHLALFWVRELIAVVRMGLRLRRRNNNLVARRGPRGVHPWEGFVDILLQDLRFAVRTLARRPSFALVAVLSLALGIGANVAVFAVVNAFLLRPLPYVQPEQLQHIWGLTRQGDRRVSVPNFLDWREQSTGFAEMAAFNYTIERLTGGEFTEEVSGGRVSANAFELLGTAPLLGRGFAAGEDAMGAAPAVVLAEAFWRERYGADPQVLGDFVDVDGVAHTIIGVMPAGFNFPLPNTDLWLPRFLDNADYGRAAGMLQIVGRLADGVSVESATTEMNEIAARLELAFPEENEGIRVRVEPLRAALNFAYETIQQASVLLTATVAFVLLVACANVANLMLARASTREREVALRAAIGAARMRVVRQMLTESVVIALIGAALGLGVGHFAVRALDTAIPRDLYRVGGLGVDATAVAYAALLALVTAAVFGIVPALRASRSDLTVALKEGSAGSGTGPRSNAWQSLMVGVEMSTAIVLLVSTALMVRSLSNLQRVDPGFEAGGVLSMRMMLPQERYSSADDLAGFHARLLEQASAVPGVTAAATVNYLPLNNETFETELTIAGRPEPPQPYEAVAFAISPDYLRVMQVPLIAGRGFRAADDRGAGRVALVDETVVERYFPEGDAVGSRVQFAGDDTFFTIVGVVGRTRQVALADGSTPVVYMSQFQSPWRYLRLLTRTEGDPTALAPALRDEIAGIDPAQPVNQVRPMRDVVESSLAPQTLVANAMSILAGGALLLALIGVYGLMSFFVSQRLRDIGICVALGATRRDVLGIVLSRVLKLSLAGIGVGVVAAFGVSQLMQSLLYGVGAGDPLTFAGAALFLLAVAIAAGLAGARRATRVDPVSALRAG